MAAILTNQITDLEKQRAVLISRVPALESKGALDVLTVIKSRGAAAATAEEAADIAIAQEFLRLEAEVRQIKRELLQLESTTTITTTTRTTSTSVTTPSFIKEITAGQLHIIFACRPNRPSIFTSHGASVVTSEFVSLMKAPISTLYPDCLRDWVKTHRTVECIDHVQFSVPICQPYYGSSAQPLWLPAEKQALVIGQSHYSSGIGLPSLDSQNDIKLMENFFQSTGFTVTSQEDISEEMFTNKMNAFLNYRKQTKQSKHLLFVYYSGHGVVIDGLVCGVTSSGLPFPLEQSLRNLSLYPNTTVFALLDCSRVQQQHI